MVMSRGIIHTMRKVSDKICRENQNTHLTFSNFFPKNHCHLWHTVENYCRAGQATGDNIIWNMCFVCCMTKGTDTFWGYVTLIAFTAAMAAQTYLSFPLYEHYLSHYFLGKGTSTCIVAYCQKESRPSKEKFTEFSIAVFDCVQKLLTEPFW
jgi:hypothetical protein